MGDQGHGAVSAQLVVDGLVELSFAYHMGDWSRGRAFLRFPSLATTHTIALSNTLAIGYTLRL